MNARRSFRNKAIKSIVLLEGLLDICTGRVILILSHLWMDQGCALLPKFEVTADSRKGLQ